MIAHRPLLGILLILTATLLLACHDGLAKHLTAGNPLLVVIWGRYMMQTLLLLAVFGPSMRGGLVRTGRPLAQLARGLSLVAISLLFVTGLRYIPLAEATAVIFLTPVLVTLASAWLGEPIRRGHWVAVGLGLAGVLVIVRPGGALFTPAILFPLAAALCFTVYQILTRRLGGTDHAVTSNFLTALIGSVTLGTVLPFQWQAPSLVDGLSIVLLGLLATVAHLLLTHAFRFASAATLAPFTYAQIAFAGLVSLVAFGHAPDATALLGMAIIASSGLYMAYLQRQA